MGNDSWMFAPEAWRVVAGGVELTDVANLAFHGFFERRQYLPVEE